MSVNYYEPLNDLEAQITALQTWVDLYYLSLDAGLGDGIGKTTDSVNGNTIFARCNRIAWSQQARQKCYPTYEGPVTVTSSNAGWFGGATATVIGHTATLDNAAAVDVGGGDVRIAAAAHGFSPGDYVLIENSINYDNELYYLSESGTINPDHITIHPADAVFHAETFAGTETVTDGINYYHVIDGVYISNLSANGDYELVIWRGAVGSEYEIARICLVKNAGYASNGYIPFKTRLQPACGWYPKLNRISASLLSSNAAVNTVDIKLSYHRFEETTL